MATCLLAAVQPAITDVNVSWILPDAYDVIYTPEKLPSVFLGERLNLYAILASKETCPDKASESGNSIKEFWFDDTDDLFQNEYEKKMSSQLALPNRDVSPYSPSKTSDIVKEDKSDYDSEVFLTEEEVRHLSHGMTFPKRSSIDRVQKWRVSKFPQNQDIGSDFEDDSKSLPEKDHQQNLHAHASTRKKSSYDGAESVGSSNSLGSNRSSSSHYYPFPGYPTRMSSCRSIEARSPHVPKMADELFSFQENNKLHSSKASGSQVNLSDYSSDHHSSGGHLSSSGIHKESAQVRPRARLTEALYAEKANTHLIDKSNEATIEVMLENLVTEKRTKLNLWLREQEEMTQCSWPITDYEKRDYMDKQEWRDSGLGNRSSSDAHTSDLEEEINTNRRRFFGSQEITSQSANKESEKEKLSRTNSTKRRTSIATPCATSATESKTTQQSKAKPKVSHKISNSSTTSSFQKRKSKARSMWNALLEKVRNVGTVVTEKSGETTFKRTQYTASTVPTDEAEAKTPAHMENSLRASLKKNRETGLYDSADDFFKNEKTITANSGSSKALERKSETPSVRPRSQGEGGHTHQTRNRPIIENSRTISTTSMFEIGKSEIGDVENLHLLPSHALIYLSGQCGDHVFKRIIPFQLEVDAAGSSALTTTDTTVHQLAAKSIIHDLELQMEDDGMLEDHGKVYIKTLISEVSKAANVLSKYTTLVTTDDKLNEDEILSVMQQKDETRFVALPNTLSGKKSGKILVGENFYFRFLRNKYTFTGLKYYDVTGTETDKIKVLQSRIEKDKTGEKFWSGAKKSQENFLITPRKNWTFFHDFFTR